LIFSFGEIDCRIHFYRLSIKTKKLISTLIDETTDRYIEALLYTRKKKILVGIHGIVPASRQHNFYNYDHYADKQTRRKISDDFNDVMINKCNKEHIPYFNIFDLPDVIAEDGLISKKVTSDLVHIDPILYPSLGIEFMKWVKTIKK
jgi:hypothetical protein